MLAQGKDIERNNSTLLLTRELDSFQQFIEREFKLKLSWYNQDSALRRIQKAVRNLHFDTLKELEVSLQKGGTSFAQFIEEFTVNVTELFREPASLQELKTSVFPFFRSSKELKILLVGSSTGEELASLCILLKENGLLERSEIIATDINNKTLEKAHLPRIKKSDLKQAEANYQSAGGFRDLHYYFISTSSHMYLEANLLNNVNFKDFDISHSYLEEDFDIILCKNLLIYFQYQQQHALINNLDRHLKPQGFLSLGQKESILRLTKLSSNYASVSSEHNIYRKISP